MTPLRNFILAAISVLSLSAVSRAEVFVYRYDNVLGTSLEVKVAAVDAEHARQADQKVLAEIERLESIGSTWRTDSELQNFLQLPTNTTVKVSRELFELLEHSEGFTQSTSGAFDPRVAAACQLWKSAARNDRMPGSAERLLALSATQQPAWRLNPSDMSATRMNSVPVTFDAIATGWIIDSACDRALSVEGVSGLLINLGGDIRLAGEFSDTISIARPSEPELNLCSVQLSSRAIVTSGNYHHFFSIGGSNYSHIIDPRTAMPVDHVTSATVVAPSATQADALATAFSVMTISESLDYCSQHPEVACFLVDKDGKSHMSAQWNHWTSASKAESGKTMLTTTAADKKGWIEGAKLVLDFEINRPAGGRLQRPYVAVWIEDKDEFPVRTLVLWLQTSGPGPRWHRDLKRWYKQDAMRKLVDETNLIGTVSAATKPPGIYKAAWDGKDDSGKPVSQGKYTLYVEAAREHGTYQLLSKVIEIGADPSEGALGENVEIKSAKYKYTVQGSKQ